MALDSPNSITRYIMLAMVLGIISGAVFGAAAAPLGIVGSLYIQLIKVVAVPLVFVSIIDAILSTSLSLKTARRWLGIITINAGCALMIGLALANLIRPGVGFSALGALGQASLAPALKEFSLKTFLENLVPKSVVSPFSENNIIAVALMALLIGVTLRQYLNSKHSELSSQQAQRGSRIISGVVNAMIVHLVKLVPLAVFCVTAKTVGESGFAPFKGLLQYVGVACLGLLLQIILVYPWWIIRIGGISLKRFWSAAARPVAYAFGTNSSLATVPLTLQALDDLGVSKSASRLATCIGTNLNNDGILLYEALAVLFVAQALGVELSLGEQVFAAVMSLFAAIGVAGVPEAGVVSLSLVLTAVGLPLEIVPLLLSVDWIVARMRSVTNVLSDMTVSIAVAGRQDRGLMG
ncbi:MAG: dicarboxylate/amino acid:cation symporter [Pseudomonadota bacterium]|jgi:Na+/H+-dicarboxylate symporter